MKKHPVVIQGGMGVGISGWRLAREVSRLGGLGVVSGTALDQVVARRLQDGDPGGALRQAFDAFPFRAMAGRVWERYFIAGGKRADEAYRKLPAHRKDASRELQELLIVANFAEVWLARQGHANPVGINYLEKIQLPHLPSIYGAMLAGVDYVLMGAGIPLKIPGVLDAFVSHSAATYPLAVTGAREGDDTLLEFDPAEFVEGAAAALPRPHFLAIIASNTLATTMLKRANGRVDGFVVEGPVAGGHNAPPRGKTQLSESGEPVYGERDVVDLAKLRETGVPFWLAGGYGSAGKLREALSEGAAGIQMGTAFAFCTESGLRADYRQEILEAVRRGEAKVFTDPLASPTGFPFKVVQLAGTASDAATYAKRPRICDLGYLREAYRAEDGAIGFRCPGEPFTTWTAKGGCSDAAAGRKCLCNALLANIDQPQTRAGGRHVEPGLVTAGDDLAGLARFLKDSTYSAADVMAEVQSRD